MMKKMKMMRRTKTNISTLDFYILVSEYVNTLNYDFLSSQESSEKCWSVDDVINLVR